MKSLILLTLCSLALSAQTAPDPVVVTIEGRDFTKSAFEALLRGLPPDLKQGYDANKKVWLAQYALMTRLANYAKKEGLDQKEPYKQQIEYNNLMFLAQSFLDAKGNSPVISSADMKRWFDVHKNQYKRAHARGILVGWGQIPKEGEKSRTDTEAAAIVEDIVKRAKAGESFADLAKQFSDDVNTKDKGGEFPLFRPEDTGINASIRAAIFTIKPSELTKAIRLPGGIYVFKLEEFIEPTMEDLNDVIITELGREQSIQWIEKIRQETKIEIKDPAFFEPAEKK
jgi:parvulin-like peptidyl-prolyl isomerase